MPGQPLSRPSRVAAILGVAVVLLFSPPAAAGRSRLPHVPDTWATVASADSIYFERGSATIGDAAWQTIQQHAARLKADPDLHVLVIAHTDDLGSSSIELAKGQERLDAVRKRLEDLGVAPLRIRTENHGSETRSLEACEDEACRSQHRRVDFLFHRR